MQPYLAVLVHNNYAKLLVLFLEKMDKMKETHTTIYRTHMEELFVLRHVIITEQAYSVICTLNRSSCEMLNQLVG